PGIRDEVPSRLVQINEDATHLRLIETHGHSFPYVALSYCWGKDDGGEWKTTTRTLKSHADIGLRSDCLPLTLQHSLTITVRLGLMHIWIDALCIVQDSNEDWAKEAAKMGGVYFGSTLTIAASGASSWSDGCFNQNSRRVVERGPYSDCVAAVDSELSTGENSRLYLSGIAYDSLVHGSPLATRGWTFQEHHLPQRTLYYTSEQLFWECQHRRCSEDNFPIQQDLRKHPVLASKPLSSDAVAELWYLGIVEDYSRRNLSFASDKLVAVSALAKTTYLRRPQPYIAGLWRDSIVHGLMWRRKGPGTKNTTSQCPSWSWAS
ncbi:HET-domain-containing protein, partial [Ophiobolus disseminans]